ncbi:glycosyltransferase family 4 protein [Candidatus Viridilinea mediisalina]|uniref:Glycosyltransferase subfamily 4-like N-terminal domain-containing protein n=1 Tax=Candidatus Viridilinea mediisalina TaxID=2024553 RepID=A0A2A6RL11_9CHLR|nr:glycosyltransferase family 4 protein [Candidatus Viridilinea mediisalina]PDW03601.1 hypothetical protein CJ255_07995 [Candidatus Viridilinea mediisalina]
MKIAVYSHYFTPEIGAPSARIYDMSRQWVSYGDQVEVVTCLPNHPTGTLYPGYRPALRMFEQLDGIGVHRHVTYITRNSGFFKKTLGHISYLPGALLVSNRHVSRPDVLIGSSPTFFAAIAAALSAAYWRRPFVMEVRDLWPAVFIELGVLRNRTIIAALERLELWLYRQATRIVTVSEAFRRNLIERGVPSEKVSTIPNGADIAYWQPQPAPEALRQRLQVDGQFVVLYSGAHGISQALAAIIACAERLREQRDITFLFVGEGAEKPALMSLARERQLDNVRFLEPVTRDEVRAFYALADVCLVPLRNIPLFESFIPSKMFEILAMGRPLVGSVAGEAAEILTRSGGALVVQPEDSNAIAQAIQTLYTHPEQRQELGMRGRAFAQTHYSREALARAYQHLLSEAIQVYSRKSC